MQDTEPGYTRSMSSNTIGYYFLGALLLGMTILTFFIFQPFLAPLILAGAFAIILHPLYVRISRTFGNWPSLASLCTVFISVVCILVPLGLVGTQIGLETADVYLNLVDGDGKERISNSVHALENRLVSFVPAAEGMTETLSANISAYAEQGLSWVIQNLGAAFSGVASLFLSLFIFFVALYFFLRDGLKLKHTLIHLSPLKDSYDEIVSTKIVLAVNSVIKGNLTIALIQGLLTGIGFTLFGVPNSVLWGAVAAIAALIPGLGTGLVFLPTVIFMYVTGHTGSALGLSIWGILAVGMIDNFLGPRLIGGGMQLHPLLILLSVLGGITFFGAIGVFLGPLSLSVLFAFLTIYSDVSRRSD